MALASDKLRALENLNSLSGFFLPKIPCSIPLRIHPDFASICKEADEWAFGYMTFKSEKEKRTKQQWRLSIYSTMLIPFGDYPKALESAKFMWVAAEMDDPIDVANYDFVDSAAAKFQEDFLNIGFGHTSDLPPDMSKTGAFKCYADNMSQFRRLVSPPVYNRFMQAQKNWASSLWDVKEFIIETYPPHRRNDYYLEVMFPLTEFCLGIVLPEKDLQSEDYTSACHALLDACWMINDICSFRKEFYAHKYKNILFILLLTDPNVHSIDDAVLKTCSQMQEKEEFLYYHRILMQNAVSTNNHDFVRYLESIKSFIPGNHRWHYLTSRYHGVDNPYVTGEPFHGQLLFHPEYTIVLPEVAAGHPYLI